MFCAGFKFAVWMSMMFSLSYMDIFQIFTKKCFYGPAEIKCELAPINGQGRIDTYMPILHR